MRLACIFFSHCSSVCSSVRLFIRKASTPSDGVALPWPARVYKPAPVSCFIHPLFPSLGRAFQSVSSQSFSSSFLAFATAMRAFTFVLALVFSQLLSFAPVSAKLNCKTAYARAPTPTSPDLSPLALRQHHEPRNLLNICIDLDTDAILGDSVILGIPLKDLLGLDLCLCLSALPLDLSVNAKLRALGDKYGDSVVNAVLSILVSLQVVTSSDALLILSPLRSTPTRRRNTAATRLMRHPSALRVIRAAGIANCHTSSRAINVPALLSM